MRQNGGESAGSPQGTEVLRLADGSEVIAQTVDITMAGLETVLDETGIWGAIAAEQLARGQQPPCGPFGDTRPVFAAYGIGRLDEDGTLRLYEGQARVIGSAVHINPRNRMQFALTSPLVRCRFFGDK